MNRVTTTIIAALINQHVVDYIKFIFIDPATTSGKQKTTLVRVVSIMTGAALWFAVRRGDGDVDVEDMFFASTTGLCSNILHDVNGLAKHTAIAAKRKIAE